MIRWPGSYLTISRCRRWGTLNSCCSSLQFYMGSFSNRIPRSAKCGARRTSTPRAKWSSNQLLGGICLIEDPNQCKGMFFWEETPQILRHGRLNRDTLKNFPVKLEGQHQHNAGNTKLKWSIWAGAWKFHHFWNDCLNEDKNNMFSRWCGGFKHLFILTPTWENDQFWQTYFEVKGLKPPASLVEVKRCLRKEALGSKSTMLPWGIWSDCSGALWRGGSTDFPGGTRCNRKVGIPNRISKWYTSGPIPTKHTS